MKLENIFNSMGFAGRLGKLGDTIRSLNENKIDKEEGKGLSSNDFVDEYKSYLDSLITSSGEGKVLSSNDFTDEYKAYLDSVMSSREQG